MNLTRKSFLELAALTALAGPASNLLLAFPLMAGARAILDFDARGELGKIACPTLILGGEEDRIVGAEASRELHGAIAGSELYIYPGLGHAAYEEAKDFNERIYRFLEG